MSAFALILAITAGIALAVQGAANAALAHHVGRLEAAVISFLGGTLVLLGVSACIGELPQLSSLGEVPLWVVTFLGPSVSPTAIPQLSCPLCCNASRP